MGANTFLTGLLNMAIGSFTIDDGPLQARLPCHAAAAARPDAVSLSEQERHEPMLGEAGMGFQRRARTSWMDQRSIA